MWALSIGPQQASRLVVEVQVRPIAANLSPPCLAQLCSSFVRDSMEFIASNSAVAVWFVLGAEGNLDSVKAFSFLVSIHISPRGLPISHRLAEDSCQEARSPSVSCCRLESIFCPAED